MDNFWNSKDLKPPLINSFKCKSPAVDLNTVVSLLQNGIDTFIPPNALRVESAVMRKVIYRLKLQFRQDKGFKLFESTNRYLNNLLSFNITRDLMFLFDQIPKKYEKDMYLPSKQMLEYVLVRLQGYSQVCGRVVENAFNTANMIKSRLPVGTQIEICVVLFAISCRIWQICRHMTTKCCLLFNDLLPLLDKLQIVGTKWLPDGYEFPKDLITWLNYNWLLEIPDIMLQLPLELPVFSLLDDEDDDIQYAGQYELQKNNRKSTVIILDSEDEDESESVEFLCSLSNTSVKLSKFEVRALESKNVIDLDSESDIEIINYDKSSGSPSESIDNMDDSDVLIVEPIVDNKTTTDSLNISGIMPLETNDEVIEIDTSPRSNKNEIVTTKSLLDNNPSHFMNETNNSEKDAFLNKESSNESAKEKSNSDTVQTTDDESEEVEKINDREYDDLGEPISQNEYISVFSDVEIEIESDKENNNTETNDSDNDDVGEPVNRDSATENNEPVQEENISDDWIYGNGKIYNVESLKRIQSLLDQENSLRENGYFGHCLFSHIQEDDWNFISFQIRYLIAFATDKVIRKNIFYKVKTMLHDILDEYAEDSWNLKNVVIFPENKTPDNILLTEKRKLSLIDSINTTKNLQIFMEFENKLRDRLFSKCFFNKLENIVWDKLYNQLKKIVVLADSRPLRRMTLLKQAKLKLKKYLKISIEDVCNADSLNLNQNSMKKFDELYKNNTLCPNWAELSEYFYAMLKYKDPPKLSINLKRKLFKRISSNLNKINTNHEEASNNQKSSSANQSNKNTPTVSKNKSKNPKQRQISPKTEQNKTNNNSENATSDRIRKMNELFEAVRAQPDYIVTPRKGKNKGKTNNQVLNRSNQETPTKLTKGQKRKLKREAKQSKKMKFGHSSKF